MTGHVILTISGLQSSLVYADAEEMYDPETAEISFTAPASYYYRNGKHYILYEEIDEDTGEITKSRIKISPDSIEIEKKGTVSSHMIFQEERTHVSEYETPFGRFALGVESHGLKVLENDNRLDASIDYILHINEAPMIENHLKLTVEGK